MWAGSLSDALQQSAAAVGLSTSSAASHLQSPDSYLTQEEVHAAFEQARRRKPDTVDARYALNRPPRQLSSSQHEDAPHLPTSAELEQPSSDDEQADLPSASSVDSYPLSDGGAAEPSTRPDSEYKQDLLSSAPDVDTPLTGSGASFAMPGDKLAWFTKLQHVWTDIMAYVHAAQQPIRFFSARPLPDNHLYCEEDDAPCAEQLQETDMAPHGFAYSPWPQPSAVKEAWQQASSQIRLQLAAAAAHLSTAQAAVSETVRHHASSAGSVVRYAQEWGKGTIKQPLQALQKSEPGVSQVFFYFLCCSNLSAVLVFLHMGLPC